MEIVIDVDVHTEDGEILFNVPADEYPAANQSSSGDSEVPHHKTDSAMQESCAIAKGNDSVERPAKRMKYDTNCSGMENVPFTYHNAAN